eukprot:TRINITY_DN2713_c0_g2_i1.p1 TRINITY_DN2713_c0_g2~~TRINITY_DN2713_c0_g2_i1.p1  ORF type:complete len:109 (-),score=9.24 TRINITY_DN2713_c0_g2_i1:25-351(-)
MTQLESSRFYFTISRVEENDQYPNTSRCAILNPRTPSTRVARGFPCSKPQEDPDSPSRLPSCEQQRRSTPQPHPRQPRILLTPHPQHMFLEPPGCSSRPGTPSLASSH